MQTLAAKEIFTLLMLLLPVLTLLIAINIVVYIVKSEIIKSTIKKSLKVFAVISAAWIIVILAFALLASSHSEKVQLTKFVKAK